MFSYFHQNGNKLTLDKSNHGLNLVVARFVAVASTLISCL